MRKFPEIFNPFSLLKQRVPFGFSYRLGDIKAYNGDIKVQNDRHSN